nr:hypothetical protein [Tanacetum cinerariifolium]
MTGRELEELSYKELDNLETELHDGVLALKNQKMYVTEPERQFEELLLQYPPLFVLKASTYHHNYLCRNEFKREGAGAGRSNLEQFWIMEIEEVFADTEMLSDSDFRMAQNLDYRFGFEGFAQAVVSLFLMLPKKVRLYLSFLNKYMFCNWMEIVTSVETINIGKLKQRDNNKIIGARVYRKCNAKSVPDLTPKGFCCILLNKHGNAIQANIGIHVMQHFDQLLEQCNDQSRACSLACCMAVNTLWLNSTKTSLTWVMEVRLKVFFGILQDNLLIGQVTYLLNMFILDVPSTQTLQNTKRNCHTVSANSLPNTKAEVGRGKVGTCDVPLLPKHSNSYGYFEVFFAVVYSLYYVNLLERLDRHFSNEAKA